MRCAQALLLTVAFASCAGQSAPSGYSELGKQALDYTRQVVELGPRPAGSEANRKQQQLIIGLLGKTGCKLTEDAFTAHTPLGPREMKNISCDFPGTSGRIVAVSGHYDTLSRPGLHFVGANDGGSSTGLLLALAQQLSGQPRKDTVRLVFFDGEESAVEWTDGDHTYGSSRMAAQWAEDGTADKLVGLLNVDMIGDADLELLYEGNSTPWLRDLVVSVAQRLGYSAQFPRGQPLYIEDDHIPFLEAGIPAVNLIDFKYGPGPQPGQWWHTADDTADKLCAESLGAVGAVLERGLMRADGLG